MHCNSFVNFCHPSAERLAVLRTRMRAGLAGQHSRVTWERREDQAAFSRVLMLNTTVVEMRGTLSVNLLPLPLKSLARVDGTIAGNPTEMQQLIHQQWCAQVCCRYANPHCQRPIQQCFLRDYHAYIPQQSTHKMPLITGAALQETLSSGGSAGGLDGRRTTELRAPPTWMWDFATDLWNAMAKTVQEHAEHHGALMPCDRLWAYFCLRGLLPALGQG